MNGVRLQSLVASVWSFTTLREEVRVSSSMPTNCGAIGITTRGHVELDGAHCSHLEQEEGRVKSTTGRMPLFSSVWLSSHWTTLRSTPQSFSFLKMAMAVHMR